MLINHSQLTTYYVMSACIVLLNDRNYIVIKFYVILVLLKRKFTKKLHILRHDTFCKKLPNLIFFKKLSYVIFLFAKDYHLTEIVS